MKSNEKLKNEVLEVLKKNYNYNLFSSAYRDMLANELVEVVGRVGITSSGPSSKPEDTRNNFGESTKSVPPLHNNMSDGDIPNRSVPINGGINTNLNRENTKMPINMGVDNVRIKPEKNTKKPVPNKPTTKKPVPKKPTTKKPVPKKPTTKKPVPKKLPKKPVHKTDSNRSKGLKNIGKK